MENTYGSLDFRVDYQPSDGVYIQLDTNIQGIAALALRYVDSSYQDLSLKVDTKTASGKHYVVCTTLLGNAEVDKSAFPLTGSYTYQISRVRIYIHNSYISVYFNERWVYSYILGYVNYITDQVVSTLSIHGGALHLYNITKPELHDYRDASYVDYEATADSAIQSVIQERPVQIYAEPGRKMTYTYKTELSSFTPKWIRKYRDGKVPNNYLSSDGLIYSTTVNINTSAETAEEVGLITRLYRLSNLENGALRAASIMQKLALERRYPVYLELRPDPRITIGDILCISAVITATGRTITDECVVEDIKIQTRDGESIMSINGRRRKATA